MIPAGIAILFAFVVVLIIALAMKRLGPIAEAVAVASGAATLVAVAVGGAWYFVERPEAAKLKIDHAASAYRLDEGFAVVIAEVTISNVGRTALRMKGRDARVLLQRITPTPEAVKTQLVQGRLKTGAFAIEQGDVWDGGLVASLPDGSVRGMRIVIEAGETENLYFRAPVPCRGDLRLYLQTQFEKPPETAWFKPSSGMPPDKKLYWIKQSVVDLTTACKGAK